MFIKQLTVAVAVVFVAALSACKNTDKKESTNSQVEADSPSPTSVESNQKSSDLSSDASNEDSPISPEKGLGKEKEDDASSTDISEKNTSVAISNLHNEIQSVNFNDNNATLQKSFESYRESRQKIHQQWVLDSQETWANIKAVCESAPENIVKWQDIRNQQLDRAIDKFSGANQVSMKAQLSDQIGKKIQLHIFLVNKISDMELKGLDVSAEMPSLLSVNKEIKKLRSSLDNISGNSSSAIYKVRNQYKEKMNSIRGLETSIDRLLDAYDEKYQAYCDARKSLNLEYKSLDNYLAPLSARALYYSHKTNEIFVEIFNRSEKSHDLDTIEFSLDLPELDVFLSRIILEQKEDTDEKYKIEAIKPYESIILVIKKTTGSYNIDFHSGSSSYQKSYVTRSHSDFVSTIKKAGEYVALKRFKSDNNTEWTNFSKNGPFRSRSLSLTPNENYTRLASAIMNLIIEELSSIKKSNGTSSQSYKQRAEYAAISQWLAQQRADISEQVKGLPLNERAREYRKLFAVASAESSKRRSLVNEKYKEGNEKSAEGEELDLTHFHQLHKALDKKFDIKNQVITVDGIIDVGRSSLFQLRNTSGREITDFKAIVTVINPKNLIPTQHFIDTSRNKMYDLNFKDYIYAVAYGIKGNYRISRHNISGLQHKSYFEKYSNISGAIKVEPLGSNYLFLDVIEVKYKN